MADSSKKASGKNRGLKNRTAISNSLANDLHKSLYELSEATDIPVSKLLDRAVRLLLESTKDSNKK